MVNSILSELSGTLVLRVANASQVICVVLGSKHVEEMMYLYVLNDVSICFLCARHRRHEHEIQILVIGRDIGVHALQKAHICNIHMKAHICN